jgi:hypothetical protein
MMKGRVAPSVVPTLVQASRQSVKIPQERHMRKKRQKVKREHDTKYPKVEEHPPTNGDIYEGWMGSNKSPQNLQKQQ